MYAVGGVLGAFASPFFGKLVDRYGSRSCLPFGFLGLCLAMQVLSHATNAPMVMVGFFMSRLFSIGLCLSVTSPNTTKCTLSVP